MPKLLSAKGGNISLGDAVGIALTKSLEERILSRFIGNGTLFSGGAKILGAVMSNKLIGGKFGDVLGTALMVDGAEDLVLAVIGGSAQSQLLGGAGQTGSVEVI
tara:strand:+ start:710 stop:1021 length:312 start_codon:yes stop_codon:yes gene_type:complete